MLKGARLAYLIESGKSNALGRQDEYVQGAGRGNREAGTDL